MDSSRRWRGQMLFSPRVTASRFPRQRPARGNGAVVRAGGVGAIPSRAGAVLDAVALGIVTAVALVVASRFDLLTWVLTDAEGRPSGNSFRDGALTAIVLTVMALGAFAWRRWRELRRDIGERARPESAPSAAEEQFRTLVEHLPVVVYTAERDIDAPPATWEYTYTSPSIEAMLGYSPAEWRADPGLWARLLHPDDRDWVLALVSQTDATGEPFCLDYRLIARDGRVVWVGDETHVHYRDDGRRLVWQGVMLDITQRRAAEAALRASEAHTAAIVESALDCIIAIDDRDRITEFNPAAERVFGHRRADVLGKEMADVIIPPAQRAPHRRGLAHVLAAGEHAILNQRIEVTALRADGTEFPVELTVVPIHSGRGFTGYLRDLTEQKATEAALGAAEEQYRRLVEQLPVVVYAAASDGHGSTRYISPQAERLLGYSPDTYLADPTAWLEVVHPDDRAAVLAEMARVEASGEPFRLTYRKVARDGREIWVQDEAAAVRDERGQIAYWQGVNLDVTAQKEAEAALRAEQAFTASIISSSADGVHAFDRDCCFTVWNPRMEQTTGLSKEEVIGRNAFDLFPFLRETGEDRCFAAALAGESTTMPAQPNQMPETGSAGYYESRFAPLRDAAGEVVGGLCVVRDVTERKVLEERLAHQACHDPLTGLPNRRLFIERVESAIARAARHDTTVAVLFLDLDDFKVVNDGLGHAAGDRLLIAVGRRLQAAIRDGDTLARLGGDEFTVLLEDVTGPGDAEAAVGRLAEGLRQPIEIDGHRLFISPSVGIALSNPGDHPGDHPADLLRRADVAMYQAKQRGKARWAFFDPGMDARVWRRLELEDDLRRALDQDQLRLDFQPLIDLATGHIAEVEALVRWVHPTYGLISPGEFIPIAEEAGLIVPIGAWVLTEACRQAQRWHYCEPWAADPTLSVNLSAGQIQVPGLVDDVARILAETGFDPTRLTLEVTETAAMHDAEGTLATLRTLREHGVRIAIDDFGTGYSAISYLRRCPVDGLKIDRSYIAGLGHDREDERIVRAIVAFARTMGLTVTAEGVETPEQLAELISLGCDFGQGYLFARPMPADQLLELIRDNHPTLPTTTDTAAAAAD